MSRRAPSWLKIKCLGNEEFVIGGYRVSDKKGRPFASLLLGEFEGGKLHYRGRVGTGFDADMLDDLGAQFAKLRRATSPFVDAPRDISRDAHWVEPKLVAQIAFTERTTDGLLRHPAFLGLRGDKPAREVQTQTVTTVAKKTKASSSADEIAGVKISHPDRVLFAKPAVTKLDLAEYFLAVSERMLPYCGGRPLSLVRCPEGPAKQCFFQKHTKKGMPAALKSVPVEEGDGEVADYLMVDSAAGPRCRGADRRHRDPPVGLARQDAGAARPPRLRSRSRSERRLSRGVREAARDVRKLLQTAGLETFPAGHRRQGHSRRRPARRQPGLGDGQELRQGRRHQARRERARSLRRHHVEGQAQGPHFHRLAAQRARLDGHRALFAARQGRSQRRRAGVVDGAVAHRSGQRVHDPARRFSASSARPIRGAATSTIRQKISNEALRFFV